MTKLYQTPVQVKLDHREMPKRFRWFGQWHLILDCRVAEEAPRSRWSLKKEPFKRYRCETYQGLVCDLYYSGEKQEWIMERVWD